MSKRPKNLDLNQLAKRIVDEAIGNEPIEQKPTEKNQAAVELGKLGGKKGGRARAESVSKERRIQIAKNAAKARWSSKQDEVDEIDQNELPSHPPKKKHIKA